MEDEGKEKVWLKVSQLSSGVVPDSLANQIVCLSSSGSMSQS